MTFQTFLREKFEARRARNARFSLRAFARSLSIDHSTLSQILRGKRHMSSPMVRALGRRLQVAETELDEYCAVQNDLAILASVTRSGFEPNSRWLAVRLGISMDAVNVALQRLLRTGALIMSSPRRWRTNPEAYRG